MALDIAHPTRIYYSAEQDAGWVYKPVPTSLCFDLYGSWVPTEIALKDNYMLVARDSRGLLVMHHEPIETEAVASSANIPQVID